MDKDESTADVAKKLEVIRAAAQHDSPVGDIETMLAEIEKGRWRTAGTDPAHGKIEECTSYEPSPGSLASSTQRSRPSGS